MESMKKEAINKILENPNKFSRDISIKKLVTILKQLSHHYYNTNEQLVPDEVYDLMRNILEERSPTNPFLKEIGSPISKDKVKLPYHMASLNKIKPDTNLLEKWNEKYDGPYVWSDK
jgi:NAD-dependent DNA ligase